MVSGPATGKTAFFPEEGAMLSKPGRTGADKGFDDDGKTNRLLAKRTRNTAKNLVRGLRCWYIPYLKSRYYSDRFRPLLSYLFTDWKCNVNCWYCFTWNNKVKGMTPETARRSIDWLRTVGCRVVALMGGEPLLRKKFILDVIKYGSDRDFFMYLPTNGILMDRDFIERAGEAGVAAINLAVDKIKEAPGLPKSFERVKTNFKHLVRLREKYGYIIFFNINITSENIEDVKELTRIARDHDIGTDYHMNEHPVIEQKHYKYLEQGFWISDEHFRKTDELIDWLVERNLEGWPMVNSAEHLRAMKEFVRGKGGPWDCRAGINSLVIRLDGTLAPCFELYSTEKDWGRVWEPAFDHARLREMKKECNPKCLSTCNYQVYHYYNTYSRGLEWVLKHIHRGFSREEDGRRKAADADGKGKGKGEEARA